ncbi:MAG: hypothetical protein IAF94_16485 [Pirellulaceae bacterium]|nr:hypothetical protein [Pirellulaceae bacterium]
MSTILVEARKDANVRPALDLIAETCRGLGHDVFRWRGPLSGRVPYWRHPFPCDLAILFNGTHIKYAPALTRLKQMGAKLLFVELGWYPQKGTVQIDPAGINARASWAGEPLAVEGRTPLRVRSRRELLVLMQLDGDTQITELSPWFANMREFVTHVCRHSALPVRVRAHPLAPPAAELVREVERLGATWDHSASLAEALAGCKAVACINSSSGMDALARRLPVLCYGLSIYRHSGAVYCLKGCEEETRLATEQLAAGSCPLFEECCDAAGMRAMDHQWSFHEIPERLPAMLEALLLSSAINPPHRSGIVPTLLRFVRDLPEHFLARRRAA